MIKNIFKVIAALLIGYFIGLLFGGALGILLGLVPSIFFREIVYSNQTVLMSVLLSLVLGGLLGCFEVLIFNRMFDANDKPLLGAFIGTIFGLVLGVFEYGVLNVSSSEVFRQEFIPVSLIYSGAVGSRIGAIIFSIFLAAGTVREIVTSEQGDEQH